MIKKTGIIFLLFGVILAFPNLYNRIILESLNKKVDVISDINVLEEYTLNEWVEKSFAGRWRPGLDYPFKKYYPTRSSRTRSANADSVTLIFNEKNFYKKACEIMKLKLPGRIETVKFNGNYYIRVMDTGWDELKEMGMGIIKMEDGRRKMEEDEIVEIGKWKVEGDEIARNVYIRPVNDKWVNIAYINWFFSKVTDGSIIFKGTEVMGFPDNIEAVKKWIKKKNMTVFVIEFANQKGFKELSKGLKVARLFGACSDDIVNKAVRGVRERNIRVIYLKNPEPEIAEAIREKLKKNGFLSGNPTGLDTSESKNLMPLFGMIIALTGLALICIGRACSVIPLSIIMVGSTLFVPGISLQVLTILAAICFPLAATEIVMRKNCNFAKGIIIYFIFSIMAGLLIGSATAGPSFFVKLEQLRCIKIALILPVILSIFIVYENINLKKPVIWEEILIFLILIGIAGICVLRSSNNQIGIVSTLEIKLRLLLENIFIFRPRFKEFLFGHPLLIAGLYFLKNKNKNFRILIIPGLIGQVSIINTFMHIHTPFMVSVSRTLCGILLGLLAGAVLIAVINKWQELRK